MAVGAPLFAAALFLGMLLFLELGRRVGLRRIARDPEGTPPGFGAVDGAVFGLLGLLVAFTFSGAASRYDARRELIVEEANEIGTAWLRLDLLPTQDRIALRDQLRLYLDSRIIAYRLIPDMEAVQAELARSHKLQGEIWSRAVVSCETKGNPATTSLVLGSLNSMFDIRSTRTEAGLRHPPLIIFELLFGTGMGCALLAGYGMAGTKSRNILHVVGFAGLLSLSVYVIMELEFPRVGLIRLDNSDGVLEQLREDMAPIGSDLTGAPAVAAPE